jgi:hypothetical protein
LFNKVADTLPHSIGFGEAPNKFFALVLETNGKMVVWTLG